MIVAEITSKQGKTADDREPARPLRPLREPNPMRRRNVIPLLITVATVALAVLFARAMYVAYMGAPWTRDATVRADVVTMAPEVEGRIIDLPLTDNQFVRKGDLLLLVDPMSYTIAVRQAEAALRQAQATGQTIDAQMMVQQAQIAANQAQVEQSQAALVFAQQQAVRYQELAQRGTGSIQNEQQYSSQLRQQQAGLASAQATLKLAQQQIDTLKAQRSSAEATIAQAAARLDQARVDLERTRILAPVNAWVTNLLAKPSDYAAAGRNVISIVDADSFWIDAYFEETQLAGVRPGDPAGIKLMAYNQIVRGHVGSIARGINVANATPNSQGLANVNPIFTWVRLAQRIPVRIQIDQVPDGVTLVAGMTATVNIEDRTHPEVGLAALPLVHAMRILVPGAVHP